MREDGTILPRQITGLCKQQQFRIERCIMQVSYFSISRLHQDFLNCNISIIFKSINTKNKNYKLLRKLIHFLLNLKSLGTLVWIVSR